MAKEYTKEEFWKLYEKISSELKEAIFSEETAESIWNICLRNGIEDERISEVARYTGRVLLGILSPNEFQEILEKELKLEKDTAKRVAQEINRSIFYPVRPALEELHKTTVAPPPGVPKVTPPPGVPKVAPPSEEKPAAPPAKDTYREPVE